MLAEDKSFKTSGGLNIFYSIHRNEKKSPFLVFIHGLGGDLAAWDEERKYFHKHGYPTLALDLRGHGLSEHAPEETRGQDMYAFPKLAQDVYDVLEHENIENPVIIGHCFGGMIGVYLQTTYKVAEKLVLVDTGYKPPRISASITSHRFLKKVFDVLLKNAPFGRLHSRRNHEVFKGSGDLDVRRILSDIAHTSLQTYLACSKSIINLDAEKLLRKIQVPVLVVVGSDDSIFPPGVASKLSDQIIHSELRVIPQANHIITINNPKALVQTIEDFIGGR